MPAFLSRISRAFRVRKVHLVGSAVALALVFMSLAWVSKSDSTAFALNGLETTPAVVGPIRAYVSGRGQLDAWKSTQLISKCYWDTRIIKLVPEGTLVKKGDVICELDATEPREYAKTRQIRLIGIKAELATAELQSQMVRIDNRRRTITAARLLEDAKLALDEYRDGNEPMTRADLDRKVKLAKDRREQAVFEKNTLEEMYLRGAATGFEVDQQNLESFTAEREWQEANSQATIHDRYQAGRTLFSLKGALSEAEAGVDATALRNALSLTQAEFAKLSDDRRFAHYTRYLGYALKSIEGCTIRAPHDGRVLYANSWRKRSYGRAEIEEGAEVDFRQAIINLPDYSRFVVKAWTDAAQINKLAIGQPVSAVVPALGERELKGTVAEIGRFPTVLDKYRNPGPKYAVTIDFDDEENNLDGLSPRMDADVEILVMDQDDVLQVPIETVFWSDDGARVVVSDGMTLSRRKVELGISNDTNVEVVDGLDEGEALVLDPPYELLERLEREESQRRDALAL
jgi:HlyD family secretion protein